MAKAKAKSSADTAANLGFEAKLWLTADKLRNNMDAAEYKHVVLGLIFLKYISDAFEERHQKLLAEVSEGADPEDPDEYRADNVFWVPMEAHWQTLQDHAKQPTIGKLIDEAMVAIERDNPRLKGNLAEGFWPAGARHRRRGSLLLLLHDDRLAAGSRDARLRTQTSGTTHGLSPRPSAGQVRSHHPLDSAAAS